MNAQHTKYMEIPVTKDHELDYEQMLENLKTIVESKKDFTWKEILVCDKTWNVLEINEVFTTHS